VIYSTTHVNNFTIFSYYFECLITELGIDSTISSNTTYKPTSLDKDEILATHRPFTTSEIVGSLVRRNDNIFVMKRGKTLNSFLVFKYRPRSTINTFLSL
jgi:hypothetical protein